MRRLWRSDDNVPEMRESEGFRERWRGMNPLMDLHRRTWIAALKLALVISVAAAVTAVVLSSLGEVPAAAIVVPVVVVAFASSWVQTGRVRRQGFVDPAVIRRHSRALPTA